VAELILACVRDPRTRALDGDALRAAAMRIEPAGDAPPAPLLTEDGGVLAAAAAPSSHGAWVERGAGAPDGATGVCVGAFIGPHDGWSRVGADPPDGTWALARWDREHVELLTDVCGSRTLWYVLTDDAFFASTSQRALVVLLGGFELDPAAVAWLLSSASLGPETSWDARVRRVPPDARVTLDRAAWRVATRQRPATFAPSGDGASQLARLRDALASACRTLDVDHDRWVLPLSGGCDSRVLLANLVAAGVRPRCVTWTKRGSLRNPLSDVSIARAVARRFRVEHEVIVLDECDIGLDAALDCFVAASEGFTDEFGGYVDGLGVWRKLRASGVDGVIRGDEPLGDRRAPETEPLAIVRNAGPRAVDYPEGHVVRRLGLAAQTRPDYLARLPGEDPRQYQVRLCQLAWVPMYLANLHGPKTRFVEIANPMLSHGFVDAVRALSPRLLGRERGFLTLVAEVSRVIPTARYGSVDSTADLLARADVLALLVRELTSPAMERVLPGDGPRLVLAAMAAAAGAEPGLDEQARAVLQSVSGLLPIRLAAALKPGWSALSLGPPALAFRAVLARRTIALLEEDARVLDRPRPAAAPAVS
jgi:hypothetical protein